MTSKIFFFKIGSYISLTATKSGMKYSPFALQGALAVREEHFAERADNHNGQLLTLNNENKAFSMRLYTNMRLKKF